jgi:hypothetical protein
LASDDLPDPAIFDTYFGGEASAGKDGESDLVAAVI